MSHSSLPRCPACGGGSWSPAFEHLTDRLYGVPGEFSVWRCESCGLLRLWPLPDDMTPYYPDDYYSYACSAPVRLHPLRRALARVRRVQLLVAWRAHLLGVRLPRCVTEHPRLRSRAFRELTEYAGRSVGSVLDIGCGSGDFLVEARALGLEVHGIEMGDPAAETARARGLACEGDGLAGLARIEQQYDVIRLSHVLEHLDDPREALRAIAKKLSERGVLILRAPNADGVISRLCGADWCPLDAPRHLWGFNRQSLELLLSQAGLRARRFETKSQEYMVYCSLRSLLNARAGLELPADPTGEMLGLSARIGWAADAHALGDDLLVIAERER